MSLLPCSRRLCVLSPSQDNSYQTWDPSQCIILINCIRKDTVSKESHILRFQVDMSFEEHFSRVCQQLLILAHYTLENSRDSDLNFTLEIQNTNVHLSFQQDNIKTHSLVSYANMEMVFPPFWLLSKARVRSSSGRLKFFSEVAAYTESEHCSS